MIMNMALAIIRIIIRKRVTRFMSWANYVLIMSGLMFRCLEGGETSVKQLTVKPIGMFVCIMECFMSGFRVPDM